MQRWVWLVILAGLAGLGGMRAKILRSPKDQGEQPAVRMKALGVIPGPAERRVRFVYPPGASNYPYWDIQASTDLSNWTTISGDLLWPPDTNGDICVTNPSGWRFYRLMGHKQMMGWD